MPHQPPTNEKNNRRPGPIASNGHVVGARRHQPTDVRVVGTQLYFLPVTARVPLKFGSETLTSVTCARVQVVVEDRKGRRGVGWGETPLSVQWVWPSTASYSARHEVLRQFCKTLAKRWAEFDFVGHPLEIGHAFQKDMLADEIECACAANPKDLQIPLLAGLVCCSPFDIALYDAYGNLHQRPAWEMLDERYLSYDLTYYLQPADDMAVDFCRRYPANFIRKRRVDSLVAWHLVGGLDPIQPGELNGNEPDDGLPALLGDWIKRDGLRCLKIKLRGNDANWDYQRLVQVGRFAEAGGVEHITADFNCTVTDPEYVVDVLDQLCRDEPTIYERLLYIEQPFPYDLEAHQVDVSTVSHRKPLLMDESAHNWELVKLGRSLGWSGVALKTCKTLTGALLSLCWAESHNMQIMVQDLTNPMLAQIPHLLLAAYTNTLLGVETNSMQFYPEASSYEALVHPGLYQRVDGKVDLSSIRGPGFGYRVDEIARPLPEPSAAYGSAVAQPRRVPSPHMKATKNVDAS